MTTPVAFRDQRRNRIVSRTGGWRVGEGTTIHGYSLLQELVGKKDFFELLFLSVMGYPPEPRLARWIGASFMCLSFPDPRIWCNQVGALGGVMRCSPVAAISAGVMASDSTLYGPGTARAACYFLRDAAAALESAASLESFLAAHTRKSRIRAPGFSRPIADGDDRVAALEQLARELGFSEAKYQKIAAQIDRILRDQRLGALNMLGFVAAFLLDQDIDIDAGHRLYSLCVNAGVHACFAEAVDAPPAAFLPLRCDDIEYIGIPARPFPHEGAPCA